jgi:hypothetical protein
MKTVTCKSGIKGWQGRLRSVYVSFSEFADNSDMYGLAERLGFSSSEEAWDKNPIIQGSINPEDFRAI